MLWRYCHTPWGSGLIHANLGKALRQALQPFGARFLVVVLHAAAGLQDLVRAHGGVADKDQLVVLVVLADDVPGVELLS